MRLTEDQLRGYQDAIREETERTVNADVGTLRFDNMRWPNECALCGRPTYHGMEYCDACRLGPI